MYSLSLTTFALNVFLSLHKNKRVFWEGNVDTQFLLTHTLYLPKICLSWRLILILIAVSDKNSYPVHQDDLNLFWFHIKKQTQKSWNHHSIERHEASHRLFCSSWFSLHRLDRSYTENQDNTWIFEWTIP